MGDSLTHTQVQRQSTTETEVIIVIDIVVDVVILVNIVNRKIGHSYSSTNTM